MFKKITFSVLAGLLSLFVIALVGCSKDSDTDTPQDEPQDDNPTEEVQEVYFSSSNPSVLELSAEETSFGISLLRTLTTDALSVPVTVTGNSDGLYTIPSTADFAAGYGSATLTVTYDPETVGYDNHTTLTFSVDYTTTLGATTYTVEVYIPSPEDDDDGEGGEDEWTSLGTGTFTDTFILYNTYDVEIQQNSSNKNKFRVVNPYGGVEIEGDGYNSSYPAGDYLVFEVLNKGDYYPGTYGTSVQVTQDDIVYFESISTGYYLANYSDVVTIHHPSDIDLTTFGGTNSESYYTYSYVKVWQDGNNLPAIVNIAPIHYLDTHGGGWPSHCLKPYVTILFPGVVDEYTKVCDGTNTYLCFNFSDTASSLYQSNLDATAYYISTWGGIDMEFTIDGNNSAIPQQQTSYQTTYNYTPYTIYISDTHGNCPFGETFSTSDGTTFGPDTVYNNIGEDGVYNLRTFYYLMITSSSGVFFTDNSGGDKTPYWTETFTPSTSNSSVVRSNNFLKALESGNYELHEFTIKNPKTLKGDLQTSLR